MRVAVALRCCSSSSPLVVVPRGTCHGLQSCPRHAIASSVKAAFYGELDIHRRSLGSNRTFTPTFRPFDLSRPINKFLLASVRSSCREGRASNSSVVSSWSISRSSFQPKIRRGCRTDRTCQSGMPETDVSPLTASSNRRGWTTELASAPARHRLSFHASSSSSSPSPSSHESEEVKEMAGKNGHAAEKTVPIHRVGAVINVPGLVIKNHWFSVPLNYSVPDGAHITIFIREVMAVDKAEKGLPGLLFLQGGPGFESPRPTEAGGWLKTACEIFRVFLMDQRGTGLSTPLSTSAILQLGSTKEQADYVSLFRADNIVRDAEFVRNFLTLGDRWTVLGQSFGGFCAVTYLSMAPSGLQQALLTGGLPPISDGCSAKVVYRALYERVKRQNGKYYQRFPEDVEAVQALVLFLSEMPTGTVALPSGGVLSVRGLQLLGLSGLGGHGGFEQLHYLLERAWEISPKTGDKRLSLTFLRQYENWMGFDTNPLYALLHESIYCQGAASEWAADWVRSVESGDDFNAVKCAREKRPVLFTGEMIFPWMFEEMEALRPLRKLANVLADKQDWPQLYDKAVLAKNEVPVAAIMYYDDMYVDLKLSEETANCIAGIRKWVTNEYMHSGIREDGGRVLDKLLNMLSGKIPVR